MFKSLVPWLLNDAFKGTYIPVPPSTVNTAEQKFNNTFTDWSQLSKVLFPNTINNINVASSSDVLPFSVNCKYVLWSPKQIRL